MCWVKRWVACYYLRRTSHESMPTAPCKYSVGDAGGPRTPLEDNNTGASTAAAASDSEQQSGPKVCFFTTQEPCYRAHNWQYTAKDTWANSGLWRWRLTFKWHYKSETCLERNNPDSEVQARSSCQTRRKAHCWPKAHWSSNSHTRTAFVRKPGQVWAGTITGTRVTCTFKGWETQNVRYHQSSVLGPGWHKCTCRDVGHLLALARLQPDLSSQVSAVCADVVFSELRIQVVICWLVAF